MFNESQIECYLKSIKLEADGDKRMAYLRFYLTPVTHELAAEAHPQIAERLFRKNGSSYDPVQEMTRAEFALNFPEQCLTYRRHPDYVGHEVMIPNVSIKKVSAEKVIKGSPDFSLIFTASFEILDKTVITDLVSLLHEKFFLTFAVAQPGLFDHHEGSVCRLCEAPNPEFYVELSKPPIYYCERHVGQKMDDEKVERIRDFEKALAAVGEMEKAS